MSIVSLLLTIIGILVGIPFALLFYAGFAMFFNWVFRKIFSALQVPDEFPIEARRDRIMTFLIFLTFTIAYINFIVLPIVYIVAISRHARERREVAAGAASPKVSRIPRIALNELLLMTFSLALFPVLVGGICEFVLQHSRGFTPEQIQQIKTVAMLTSFAIAIILFPICFASAYHRLDSNDVPLSRLRMAFLFCYPYMTLALPATIYGVFMVIGLLAELTRHGRDVGVAVLGIAAWLASIGLIVFGGVASNRLKRSALSQVPLESPPATSDNYAPQHVTDDH